MYRKLRDLGDGVAYSPAWVLSKVTPMGIAQGKSVIGQLGPRPYTFTHAPWTGDVIDFSARVAQRVGDPEFKG